MRELYSFEINRLRHVERIVKATYDRLVRTVIAHIKALPDKCRQSGDESDLKDVWEEFKYQLQREEFGSFDLYEQTIQDMCDRIVAELDPGHQELLWLWSEAFDRWDDDKDEINFPVAQTLSSELNDRVCSIACDEELAIDPDEERDRERFEDDLRA
jgi:hypothetical protein